MAYETRAAVIDGKLVQFVAPVPASDGLTQQQWDARQRVVTAIEEAIALDWFHRTPLRIDTAAAYSIDCGK